MAKIVLERETTYIPQWEDNGKEPAPISFRLRYLTTGERHRFAGKPAMDAIIDSASNGHEPHFAIDFEGMFRTAVVGIDDLVVEIDGKEEKVTTAARLLELPSFNGMFMEVSRHIASMNARVDARP